MIYFPLINSAGLTTTLLPTSLIPTTRPPIRVIVTAGHCVSPSVGGTVDPLVYLGLEKLQQTATAPGGSSGGASGGSGGGRLMAAAAAGGVALMNALTTLVGLGSTGGRAGGPALRSRSVPHPKYNPGCEHTQLHIPTSHMDRNK